MRCVAPRDRTLSLACAQWRMWLYHHRDLPPTNEEILRSQRERQVTLSHKPCFLYFYIYNIIFCKNIKKNSRTR